MTSPVPYRSASAVGLLPLLIVLAVGTGWGFGVSLVKFAIVNGIRPYGYLFWVASGAEVVSLIVCLVRHTRPRLDGEHLRYYALTGAIRIAGANVVFYTVIEHVPAGVMSVVLGTAPIFTYAMSLMMRMEPFATARLVGIVCGLAGMVLFIAPESSLPDPAMAVWVAFGLGAPFLYSVANIVIDRLRPAGSDSVMLSVGMLAAASLFVLPIALATGTFHALWPPFSLAELGLMLHMVISGLAFYGLFELIRMSGPTYASQITYIVTLTGVTFGIVIFAEIHSIWVWAATAMVLGGVGLVNLRRR
jgi:drug/metabolite transporter (DMT)-like permease